MVKHKNGLHHDTHHVYRRQKLLKTFHVQGLRMILSELEAVFPLGWSCSSAGDCLPVCKGKVHPAFYVSDGTRGALEAELHNSTFVHSNEQGKCLSSLHMSLGSQAPVSICIWSAVVVWS